MADDTSQQPHQDQHGQRHLRQHHSEPEDRYDSLTRRKRDSAAILIQKNYRGYRTRQQLEGLTLDASDRWIEAVKEAQWRNKSRPLSRSQRSHSESSKAQDSPVGSRPQSQALQTWKRVGAIAMHAGGDDSSEDAALSDIPEEDRAEYKRLKAKHKRERQKTAKLMDLQYWLEMVDPQHRYGSHLRAYHEEWKKSGTTENFFTWLDEGEGANIELPTCSRERLNKDKVRYLSREERMDYLVKVDDEGRLCWAKNGHRICTTMEYKDSIMGVVPVEDPTPPYRDEEGHTYRRGSTSSDNSSLSSGSLSTEAEHYVNHDLDQAKGLKKIRHVSAAVIFNRLLQGTVKPNSWIFVADTSFRLYVGIKQSGAFQHSSFLNGARISAAGLIKIKDGQLRRLSPLSGHYRPPASNFRAFVHSLRDTGVDMSRVSISRSYAVLAGLEMYVKTRRKIKHGVQHTKDHKDKMLHPEEVRKREEAKVDRTEAAMREREVLAEEARKREELRKQNSFFHSKIWRRLKRVSISDNGSSIKMKGKNPPSHQPGQDIEDGIPPAGKR